MSRPEPDYITAIKAVADAAEETADWYRLDSDTIDNRIADAFDRFANELRRKWV